MNTIESNCSPTFKQTLFIPKKTQIVENFGKNFADAIELAQTRINKNHPDLDVYFILPNRTSFDKDLYIGVTETTKKPIKKLKNYLKMRLGTYFYYKALSEFFTPRRLKPITFSKNIKHNEINYTASMIELHVDYLTKLSEPDFSKIQLYQ